jgi:hypothetical protein
VLRDSEETLITRVGVVVPRWVAKTAWNCAREVSKVAGQEVTTAFRNNRKKKVKKKHQPAARIKPDPPRHDDADQAKEERKQLWGGEGGSPSSLYDIAFFLFFGGFFLAPFCTLECVVGELGKIDWGLCSRHRAGLAPPFYVAAGARAVGETTPCPTRNGMFVVRITLHARWQSGATGRHF